MKHIFFLLSVLILPMLGSAVEGIRLVCDEPVYDFGRVDQSAVITHQFTIRNEGDRSFVLQRIRTSCSCTKGQMSQRIIGPGEVAQLTAVFTAARRKGPQKKGIRLISVDSDEPTLVLYLEGFVEPAAL